jgi:hypothetical protein
MDEEILDIGHITHTYTHPHTKWNPHLQFLWGSMDLNNKFRNALNGAI